MELQVDQGLALQGDERRLVQLLTNLLENSLRYTDSPGRVQVRAVRTAAAICLDISDTAPGVTPDQLSRLFDRLYRVETSRSRQHGGSGLGLAICRSIVQAHGGRMTAEAAALGGLSIRIVWPVQPDDRDECMHGSKPCAFWL